MKILVLGGYVLTSSGCIPELAMATSAAANAYAAKKNSERKVYGKECLFMKAIYLDPNFSERLTEQERRDINTHNEKWAELCPTE